MNTRTDCPKFDGWAALDWKREIIVNGDRFVYIGTKAMDEGRYLTPETGYKMNDFHAGSTCLSNWGSTPKEGCAVYRKRAMVSDGYTSRASPLPMNKHFTQVTPLP